MSDRRRSSARRHLAVFLRGRVLEVDKTVADSGDGPFDCIAYFNKLDRIPRDSEELRLAVTKLAPEGHLVIVAPAHPALYSKRDRAIGRFRRYDRKTLQYVVPEELRLRRLIYVDATGVPALSRFVDPLLGYRVGRSILGVWEKR